jgi:NAD(P)-dependent dehydrogenase (short-subunit alcohol dehydrogenase family)
VQRLGSGRRFGQRVVDLVEDQVGALVQAAARVGERQPAGRAVHQCRAEAPFELFQRAGEGGLADPEDGRGGADGAFVADGGQDITDPDRVAAMYRAVGPLDAVVCAAGHVPFKPVTELTPGDYLAAFHGKVLSQIDLVRQGITHVAERVRSR